MTDNPLLNPDSVHYQMIGGKEAIEELEAMFTNEELLAWSKVTTMKYRLRIGNKGNAEDHLKDIKKIQTFEAYYKHLEKGLTKC